MSFLRHDGPALGRLAWPLLTLGALLPGPLGCIPGRPGTEGLDVDGTGGGAGAGGGGAVADANQGCHALKLLSNSARISMYNTGFGTGQGDFTLDLWAKFHGEFEGQRLFDTNEEYLAHHIECTMAPDGESRCRSYPDRCEPACEPGHGQGFCKFTFPKAGWHHLAYVRASNVTSVYVDGALVATDSMTVDILAKSAVAIGKPDSGAQLGAAPALVGPLRFSNIARYSGRFTPAMSWPVDAYTVAQYLVEQPLGEALVDEAGDDNTSTSEQDVQAWDQDVPCTVTAWLSARPGGFCIRGLQQSMNLCGDVRYCDDKTLLKTYEGGLAIDVGFYWAGGDTGYVLNAGGDTGKGENVLIQLRSSDHSVVASGPGVQDTLVAPIAPGRHLVSYYANTTSRALYIDGALVAEGAGTGTSPRLAATNGPGFRLGARMSDESKLTEQTALTFAPFFFHLREASPAVWSFAGATTASAESVVFFDAAGALGSSWTSSVNSDHVAQGQGGITWTSAAQDECK